MLTPKNYLPATPPVVIGGLGGSGTRLIAECLKHIGFSMGQDLNHANDNLLFTLLFKRTEALSLSQNELDTLLIIFLKGMNGDTNFTTLELEILKDISSIDRPQHPAHWLQERVRLLLSQPKNQYKSKYWGWKEPNSHIFLDFFSKSIPDMKYIHVCRNGLDMAYSTNQNQLKFWGDIILGQPIKETPYYSLKYWCESHKRILILSENLGSNFYLLNYDKFCTNPEEGINNLSKFLKIDLASQKEHLKKLIQPPKSIGRHKNYGIESFDKNDIDYVHKLGFDFFNY